MGRKLAGGRTLRHETLEDRRLLAFAGPDDYLPWFFYHPDTDPGYVQGHPSSGRGLGRYTFNDQSRWSQTATDGGGLTQGDPTTVTWGIAPDGTQVPAAGGGGGSAASDLVAFMDNIYGNGGGGAIDQRPWFPLFSRVFDRWSEVNGVTYVYEPMDDAVAFSSANNGVLGTRPDVRIGGRAVDGNGGILAFNFFPDYGEMVIDTNDNTYQQNAGQNDDLFLRNIVAHEQGHGLGIAHSCPIEQSKLMEPFLSLQFDGPQEDDVLAVQRGYGDNQEPNDAVDEAADLGAVTEDTVLSIGNIDDDSWVSVDDVSDVDVYRFTVTGGTASITLTPRGSTYLAGPQNPDGSCSSGSTFDASRESNLTLELIAPDGSTVLATADLTGQGEAEEILDFSLPGSGEYFVRVTGEQPRVQLYQLDVALSDVPSTPGPGPGPGGGGPGVGGVKWGDADGDGIQDDDEEGLGGFYIYVDLDRDGRIDVGEPAVITASDGSYFIDFDEPGEYLVREVLPPGWEQTFPGGDGSHTVTLGQNLDNSNVNFGNFASNDWGDAPAPYPTLQADQGAVHGILAGFHLGASVDAEGDANPNALGEGDDNLGSDDEDGIEFRTPLFAGGTATIEVTVETGSLPRGSLQGWVDFNRDGDWDDPGEQVVRDMQLATGTHLVSFAVPADAEVGNTFTRFRYGYEKGIGPTGPAFAGEVEDHAALILLDAPVANDDQFIVEQDSLFNAFPVLQNDFSSSSGGLRLASVGTTSQGGTVTISGRNVLYSPPRNFFSGPNDVFTYTVEDNSGNQSVGTVTVNVTPKFESPVTLDDAYRIPDNEDTVLDVLANDIAGTRGPLTIISASVADGGIVFIDNNSTVDPTDDVIVYRPTTFNDFDQFTYTVSNAVGELSTATVTLYESPDEGNDDVLISLVPTDLDGNPISQVNVGEDFQLKVQVQDGRSFPIVSGVSAVYLDVLYPRDAVSVVLDAANSQNFDIEFSDDYPNAKSGTAFIPGILDEVGAFQSGLNPKGTGVLDVFAVTFTANRPGFIEFTGDPADSVPSSDVLLFDPTDPVALNRIRYGFAGLEIVEGSADAVRTAPYDVNADGEFTPLDALAIINELNARGPRTIITDAEGESRRTLNVHRMDMNLDTVISPLDALIVVNELNRRVSSRGEGEAVRLEWLAVDPSSQALSPLAAEDSNLEGWESTAEDSDYQLQIGERINDSSNSRSARDSQPEFESLLDILADDVLRGWSR